MALQNMEKDVSTLVKAAVEGKLATRADATKHQGDYRKIVEGRQPDPGRRDRAVERVRRVRGPHLEGRYPAQDHRHLQRRLQRNQEQPEHLHRRRQPRWWPTAWQLTQAMLEGKLATRADATKHQGDFRKVDRGLQPDAGQRHQAVERVRRVRGPHLEGRHSAQDHRHLQRRLQRNQEQPERLHRHHQRAGGRRRPAGRRRRWKASWRPAPTPPSTRATTARSSKASTRPWTR